MAVAVTAAGAELLKRKRAGNRVASLSDVNKAVVLRIKREDEFKTPLCCEVIEPFRTAISAYGCHSPSSSIINQKNKYANMRMLLPGRLFPAWVAIPALIPQPGMFIVIKGF